MKLERLEIKSASKWDKFQGYRGEITFDGPLGKVQIQTGDEMSRQILEVCARQLIDAAQQVAQELTTSVIEQVATPELRPNIIDGVKTPAIESPAE